MKGLIASATHMAALTQRIGWAYSAAMIDHSQSVSSSVQKPRTPSIAFAAIRHCCPCWHKMIARAWQVSHAIPGWCVTGEDWLLQRRESKDDELASQPTMSLGRRMIQWMEWRWPATDSSSIHATSQLTGDLVGFQFFIPFLDRLVNVIASTIHGLAGLRVGVH